MSFFRNPVKSIGNAFQDAASAATLGAIPNSRRPDSGNSFTPVSDDKDLETTKKRFAAGRAEGRDILNDERLKNIESRYLDLSKGFSGQELGARRALARNEINAQENQALARLRSEAGRGGVGGARAAALQGNLRQNLARTNQDTERKLLLDEGQQIRQGLGDYSDVINQRKLLETGLGVGYAQLGSARDAANAAAAANKGGKK